MSMQRCTTCDSNIDTDFDLEHFEVCAEEKYSMPGFDNTMNELDSLCQQAKKLTANKPQWIKDWTDQRTNEIAQEIK